MLDLILMFLNSLLMGFRSRAALQPEIIALRHQLTVLQRTAKPKRLNINRADRCLWVWLSRLWTDWRSSLIIVKPETVIGWHRQGFRWYWTWKIRHGRPGRPQVPKETRDLIRTMSRENPIWGAPRIPADAGRRRTSVSTPQDKDDPSRLLAHMLERQRLYTSHFVRGTTVRRFSEGAMVKNSTGNKAQT